MDVVHGTRGTKTSKFTKEDDFSSMLPSDMVFDEHFFIHLLGASQATNKISDDWRNVILKLLIHLVKGSVTKFILYLPRDMTFDVKDINNWFLFLSGKGISDVTVNNDYDNTRLKLPAHFFSCGQLMHLNLQNCGFDPPPSFRGFPNLLSLVLYRNTRPLTSSRVIQLVASFPKLEELRLNFGITFLTEAGGNKMDYVLIATFPCPKTLKLRFIDLASDIMASYVLKMIRSSPNLQTLNIWVEFFDDVPHHALSSSDLDCSTMGMLQLQSAVFVGSDCSENKVYLTKFLLACSPLLKEIVIGIHPSKKVNESHKFSTKLLKLHRASPVAEIDFSYFSDPFSFIEFSSNFG
uniref:uncharacterized protein LOC122595319 n=1 Tax=Erigeron canadensis TaxID=72917 RepID=UPI001CB8BBFD|nr:uncharacterized protein LOC122595319 [Erigeron canadensis]